MTTKKGNDPHVAWRLEAFDLRAGLAFATYREEQTSTQTASDWPCLYFSPPGFSAEPVDNIAAAFAATRGTFDSNLIIDGREASFETPAEVGEFVRRAYVSSAGGDGADGPGGGAEPPLPPNPEGPNGPPPDFTQFDSTDQRSAARALLGSVDRFNESVQKSPSGQSFRAVWSVDPKVSTVGALASGAVLLMLEMLDRLPRTGDLGAQRRWIANARTLGDAITALGLWNELLDRYDGWLHLDRHRLPNNWLPNYGGPRVPASVLFFPPHAMPDGRWPFWDWPDPRLFELLTVQRVAADPFECIAQWPVPRFANELIPEDARNEASVAHLLAAFLSCPSSIWNSTSSPKGVLDVVIFTSACLVTWRLPRLPNMSSPLTFAAIDERGHSGMQWLIEQLPLRGFSRGYEALLAGARTIRYRSK
ncbi:MAG: hypothetical protein IAE86_20820 [Burkholderiaceae bacterium]|nr:hypothetical protein [Burkholderiaceae bacterium]